jgi:hypothetical protein
MFSCGVVELWSGGVVESWSEGIIYFFKVFRKINFQDSTTPRLYTLHDSMTLPTP